MSGKFNITIGFSTTRQLISRLIRWATRSSCSHTYIAFYDYALEMRMVLQSQPWGFEIRPWSRWIKDNILVAEYRPVAGSLEESLIYIAGLLGTKFDYSSALLTGIKAVLQRWHRSGFTVNPNRSPHKLVCPEAVVRFLIHGSYLREEDFNPETTSPADLLREVAFSDKYVPLFVESRFINYDPVLRKADLKNPAAPKLPDEKNMHRLPARAGRG